MTTPTTVTKWTQWPPRAAILIFHVLLLWAVQGWSFSPNALQGMCTGRRSRIGTFVTPIRSARKTGTDRVVPERRQDKWQKGFEEYRSCAAAASSPQQRIYPQHVRKWASLQRYRHKQGALNETRVALLNEIGFQFESTIDDGWMTRYKGLQKVYRTPGSCWVSRGKSRQSRQLYDWVANQRKNYRAGKLSKERIDKLEAIGFEWQVERRPRKPRLTISREDSWGAMFDQLERYAGKHGHCSVRKNQDKKLFSWLEQQRRLYRASLRSTGSETNPSSLQSSSPSSPSSPSSLLSDERISRLRGLNVSWFPAVWQERFDELVVFRDKHGHTLLPPGHPLAGWAATQRAQYRCYQRDQSSSSLTEDQIEALTGIGFVWNTVPKEWTTAFWELCSFKAKHGTTKVPLATGSLGRWVWQQRKERESLTEIQTSLLDTLGFDFHASEEALWQDHFMLLLRFVFKHRHAFVTLDNDESGLLVPWVREQRIQFYRRKEGKSSTLDDDRIEKLEKARFFWEARSKRWYDSYLLYKQYAVSDKASNSLHKRLSTWAERQRQEYWRRQNGEESAMTDERAALLGSIGFEFSVSSEWETYQRHRRRFSNDKVWEAMFEKLRKHQAVVKENDQTTMSSSLSAWQRHQRHEYRRFQRGKPTLLTIERIKLLNSTEFVWDINESSWKEKYNALRRYQEKNGNTLVSAADSPVLAQWVKRQRLQYRLLQEGKASLLSKEKIKMLREVGFVFDVSIDRWMTRYHELMEYRSEHGTTVVPRSSGPLGQWVGSQRKLYAHWKAGKKSTMTSEKADLLDEIGFEWTVNKFYGEFEDKRTYWGKEDNWQSNLALLREFQQTHGHCLVPLDSGKLGEFVRFQRIEHRRRQLGKPSCLTDARFEALEGLGFVWRVTDNAWNVKLSLLRRFVAKHGNALVSKQNDESGILVPWVHYLRRQYRLRQDGRTATYISIKQIEQLNELGFVWDVAASKFAAKYQELEAFYDEHGHSTVVPLTDQTLSRWVYQQRRNYRAGKMQSYQKAMLDRLDFAWNVTKFWEDYNLDRQRYNQTDVWERNYRSLREYKKVQGNTLVPANSGQLGQWVRIQRHEYRLQLVGKLSCMTTERISRLDALDFVWRVKTDPWMDTYNVLKDFQRKRKTTRVPENFRGDKLAKWTRTQRKQYRLFQDGKKSSLTREKVRLLDKIGFSASLVDNGPVWMTMFKRVHAFHTEHGHCRIPNSYPELKSWLHNQRTKRKAQKNGQWSSLTTEQIKKLESLKGFSWEPYVDRWSRMLSKLKAYAKAHDGDTRVPIHYKDLGRWVHGQRTEFRLKNEGKPSRLSDEQIESLNEVGFVWRVSKTWDECFLSLQEYRRVHGHTLVPKSDKDLGSWVGAQRHEYKRFQSGNKSHLTREQVERLDSIGFVWNTLDLAWTTKLERLKAMVEDKDGNVTGAPQLDKQMRRWIGQQRSKRKQGSLSEQRVQALDAIGFVWEASRGEVVSKCAVKETTPHD